MATASLPKRSRQILKWTGLNLKPLVPAMQVPVMDNKVVLVVNVAQMNELMDRFGSTGKFQILGAPCNQFGHQENGSGEEILNGLKYVRPGKGFVPNFPLLEKADVNGPDAQPLFKLLRAELPYPCDRTPEMDMESPYGIMKPGNVLGGQTATPTDVKWNFEKFLIDARGVPRYRFSPKFSIKSLIPFIEELLKEMT